MLTDDSLEIRKYRKLTMNEISNGGEFQYKSQTLNLCYAIYENSNTSLITTALINYMYHNAPRFRIA